jgi:hypothetical protein
VRGSAGRCGAASRLRRGSHRARAARQCRRRLADQALARARHNTAATAACSHP